MTRTQKHLRARLATFEEEMNLMKVFGSTDVIYISYVINSRRRLLKELLAVQLEEFKFEVGG